MKRKHIRKLKDESGKVRGSSTRNSLASQVAKQERAACRTILEKNGVQEVSESCNLEFHCYRTGRILRDPTNYSEAAHILQNAISGCGILSDDDIVQGWGFKQKKGSAGNNLHSGWEDGVVIRVVKQSE